MLLGHWCQAMDGSAYAVEYAGELSGMLGCFGYGSSIGIKGFVDLAEPVGKLIYFCANMRELGTDLLYGFFGLIGKLADFFGNDGKSPTMLAGTRGLNRSIQREQIGLL